MFSIARPFRSANRFVNMATGAILACLAALPSATPADAAIVTRLPTGQSGTDTLMLSGTIVAGDLTRLMTEVAKIPAGRKIAVVLDSPGGSVAEGLAMGRFFHSRRIATYVVEGGAGCHSACSLAFLGGRNAAGEPFRVMFKGAKLGFHQIKILVDSSKTLTPADAEQLMISTQQTIGLIETYLRDVDAAPEFLAIMLRTPNTTMTLIPSAEAPALGIHVMDPQTRQLAPPVRAPARVASN